MTAQFVQMPDEILEAFAKRDKKLMKISVEAMKEAKAKLLQKKNDLIERALARNFIKKKDIKIFKDDDFIELLNLVANQDDFKEEEIPLFITNHKKILEKKDYLNNRMDKIKIIDVLEALERMKKQRAKQDKKETDYIG